MRDLNRFNRLLYYNNISSAFYKGSIDFIMHVYYEFNSKHNIIISNVSVSLTLMVIMITMSYTLKERHRCIQGPVSR